MKKKIGLFLVSIVLIFLVFQFYLFFHMDAIDFRLTVFQWGISVLAGLLFVWGCIRKKRIFIVTGLVMLSTIICVIVSLPHIEKYFYNKAVHSSMDVKDKLYKYHQAYKRFPNSLLALYPKGDLPYYRVGLLTYSYGYIRTSSSCKIEFGLFEGKRFCSYGFNDSWTYCD